MARDIQYKIAKMLSKRFRQAVRANYSGGTAVRLLGCSIDFFKLHIESQFEIGMSWDNWGHTIGKWSIDHIVPMTAFDLTVKEQVAKCCHYTNLRPMWQSDNVRKGGANRWKNSQLSEMTRGES